VVQLHCIINNSPPKLSSWQPRMSLTTSEGLYVVIMVLYGFPTGSSRPVCRGVADSIPGYQIKNVAEGWEVKLCSCVD
jgi:hypothetical protein